ncbi:hypothetical protein ACHAW5_002583 [Stephanodiscus triporus]|uniref:Cyclin-like domain-containing protein n=1 Tax=Stephanodiscus triporus TaxID=2934178 RepID=A0ABD3MD77_9STRA
MVFTREEYLIEISQRLKGMRNQEASHYVVPDYLAAEWQQRLRKATDAACPQNNISAIAWASDDHESQINKLWCEKICEWCYQVVDHFDLNREVVSVAMSYRDRYLATHTINRRIFQLAAMTALHLAIKLHEQGKLSMSSFIDLSRGYFMEEHIVTMDEVMLQSLGWHVHPPTPLAFCRDFMRLVSGEIEPGARRDISELARFMTELSVCSYWFSTKRPSSIALAAVISAIELHGPCRVDPRYKAEFLTRVVDLGIDIACNDEVLACYERLRQMYDAGGYTPTFEDTP